MQPSTTKHYLVFVKDGIEPSCEGPVAEHADLQRRLARALNGASPEETPHVLFGATVDSSGELAVWAFSAQYVDEALARRQRDLALKEDSEARQ